MDERLQLVARRLAGEPMAELCRDFGISRKTGYKIFERYQECGVHGLTDRSRRPCRYAVAKIRGFLDKGGHQGCILLAKHEFTIQLVTKALREFAEARKAVIVAVERAEEERNRQ